MRPRSKHSAGRSRRLTRPWAAAPRKHPEVVSAVMIAASLDWAAMTIAAALVTEEESVPHNRDPAWCGRRVWCGHENVGRRQL